MSSNIPRESAAENSMLFRPTARRHRLSRPRLPRSRRVCVRSRALYLCEGGYWRRPGAPRRAAPEHAAGGRGGEYFVGPAAAGSSFFAVVFKRKRTRLTSVFLG